MSRTKDWFPSIERVEDKAPLREMLTSDIEAYLSRGGQIEQAVSVTLRCVKSTDSHDRVRPIWAPEVRTQSETDLKRPFNRRGPPAYGRDHVGSKLAQRQIRAGLKIEKGGKR